MAFVPYAPFEERRGEKSAQRQRHLLPPMTAFRNQRCSARIMPSTETPLDGSLAWWDEDIRAFWGFVSSCEWVVASLPWRCRGPHRRGVVGLTARRRRRSVHRLAEMASRRRFGALVYTVAPWAWVVGSLGIAIVYTNGRIGPLRAVLGRLCTLLGCCAVASSRGDAGVYTNRREQDIWMVLLRFVYTIVPLGAPRGRPPLRTAPITSL